MTSTEKHDVPQYLYSLKEHVLYIAASYFGFCFCVWELLSAHFFTGGFEMAIVALAVVSFSVGTFWCRHLVEQYRSQKFWSKMVHVEKAAKE